MNTQAQEFVINFHMTEACNYHCAYCYAKWTDEPNSKELYGHPGEIKKLLTALADYFFNTNDIQKELCYQNVRINFAGGEPMMLGKHFTAALAEARALGFRTSVITNGHFLTSKVLKETAPMLDMLGISFDTADELIAHSIGRSNRRKRWLDSAQLMQIADLYRKLNPAGQLKINTVVNPFNSHENLSTLIAQVKPNKWKLLRVLPVHDATQAITDSQYQAYIERQLAQFPHLTVEDNEDMWQSYLMINPRGQFYQNSGSSKGHLQSEPILKAGVSRALSQVPFNLHTFASRYHSKEDV